MRLAKFAALLISLIALGVGAAPLEREAVAEDSKRSTQLPHKGAQPGGGTEPPRLVDAPDSRQPDKRKNVLEGKDYRTGSKSQAKPQAEAARPNQTNDRLQVPVGSPGQDKVKNVLEGKDFRTGHKNKFGPMKGGAEYSPEGIHNDASGRSPYRDGGYGGGQKDKNYNDSYDWSGNKDPGGADYDESMYNTDPGDGGKGGIEPTGIVPGDDEGDPGNTTNTDPGDDGQDDDKDNSGDTSDKSTGENNEGDMSQNSEGDAHKGGDDCEPNCNDDIGEPATGANPNPLEGDCSGPKCAALMQDRGAARSNPGSDKAFVEDGNGGIGGDRMFVEDGDGGIGGDRMFVEDGDGGAGGDRMRKEADKATTKSTTSKGAAAKAAAGKTTTGKETR